MPSFPWRWWKQHVVYMYVCMYLPITFKHRLFLYVGGACNAHPCHASCLSFLPGPPLPCQHHERGPLIIVPLPGFHTLGPFLTGGSPSSPASHFYTVSLPVCIFVKGCENRRGETKGREGKGREGKVWNRKGVRTEENKDRM